MGRQNNRICIICQNPYHYCPNCGEDAGKPTWYFIFDSERCHDIYDICTSYRDNIIDIKTAYERLSKIDLKDLDVVESTRAQIDEIMSCKQNEIKSVEKASNKEAKDDTKSTNKNVDNTKFKFKK